jgi:hypothetical protein
VQVVQVVRQLLLAQMVVILFLQPSQILAEVVVFLMLQMVLLVVQDQGVQTQVVQQGRAQLVREMRVVRVPFLGVLEDHLEEAGVQVL